MSESINTTQQDLYQNVSVPLLVFKNAIMTVAIGFAVGLQPGSTAPSPPAETPAPEVRFSATFPILSLAPASPPGPGDYYSATPAFGIGGTVLIDLILAEGLGRHFLATLDTSDPAALGTAGPSVVPGIGTVHLSATTAGPTDLPEFTLSSNARIVSTVDFCQLTVRIELDDDAAGKIAGDETLGLSIAVPIQTPPGLPAITAAVLEWLGALSAPTGVLAATADFGIERGEVSLPLVGYAKIQDRAVTVLFRPPGSDPAWRSDRAARGAELDSAIGAVSSLLGPAASASMDPFTGNILLGEHGTQQSLVTVPHAPRDVLAGTFAGDDLMNRFGEAVARLGEDQADPFARITRAVGANLYYYDWIAGGAPQKASLDTQLNLAAPSGVHVFDLQLAADNHMVLEFLGPSAASRVAVGYASAATTTPAPANLATIATALSTTALAANQFPHPGTAGFSIPRRGEAQRVRIAIAAGPPLRGRSLCWSAGQTPGAVPGGAIGGHSADPEPTPAARELLLAVEVKLLEVGDGERQPQVGIRYAIQRVNP